MPAGGSGLCSQLPVGKRCQPGSTRCPCGLFGMSCPGGRAGRAGGVTRVPCHGHSPSRHHALLHSPSPGSGSLVPRPSRWAAWPCPWSSRPGTEGGTGVAPWHRTRVCVLPLSVSAEGLPPGSATPSHGLAAPGTRMLFSARGAGSLLLTFPTSLLAPWASAAVGRELLAEQGPPGSPLAIRGSAPSPKCVGGSRRCLTLVHPGCTHPECCDAAARTGWAGRGTEKEAVGSDVDVPRGRCSDIP